MDEPFDIRPGKRIRALRIGLKLSRKEFWEITGFSAATLKELEIARRTVSPSKARILSNLFIYRFGKLPEEASEAFILHGEHQNNEQQL